MLNLKWPGIVSAALCMVAGITPQPTLGGGHDKTPDGTVKAFFEAVSREDWIGTFSRIEGSKMNEVLAEMKTGPKASPNRRSSQALPRITNVSVNGSTATVTVQMANMGLNVPEKEDVATLHLVNGDWKIVGGKEPRGLLEQIAEVSRDPAKLKLARQAAKKTVVISNFKQISLALIMYTLDYDDKFALTQAKLHGALLPYLKIDAVWKDGDQKPMDVRLNPWLIGKKSGQVPDPAACVMISLGSKGHLQELYGMTPVGFCDGHVKMMTLSQAAKLSWK